MCSVKLTFFKSDKKEYLSLKCLNRKCVCVSPHFPFMEYSIMFIFRLMFSKKVNHKLLFAFLQNTVTAPLEQHINSLIFIDRTYFGK